MVQLLERHPALLVSLGAGSLVLLVSSALALPWLIRRLPSDYLTAEPDAPSAHPVLRLVVAVLRNIAASVLLVAGVAMLVLPGQGLLTIAAAVAVSTAPGKRRLLRWIASRPVILRAMNRIRKRAGVAELEAPDP